MIPAKHLLNIGWAAMLLVSGRVAAAEDQQAAVEMKLRDSLRSTMLQLRAAEGEKVTLQAAKAEAEKQAANLGKELEKLSKQASADKIAAEKSLTELRGKLTETEAERSQTRDSLGKWQTAYSRLADAAKQKETERARLDNKAAVAERKVEEMQARNVALYKLGNEILTRYEKFSLGEALKAREPFTGVTRARLESLVQDYGDKLEEQRIKPESAKRESPRPDEPKPQPSKPQPANKP